MMLKIIQNCMGEYQVFRLAIAEDNGEILKKDGIDCVLYYSSLTEDRNFIAPGDFKDWFENGEIGYIFNKCLAYSDRVWSSKPYKKQCLAFWKVFKENQKELLEQFRSIRDKDLNRELAVLNREVETKTKEIKAISSKEFDEYKFDESAKEQLKIRQKWLSESENELNQVKDGTEKFLQILEKIKGYEDEIKSLESILVN